MMVRMSDEDCKLLESIAGWFAFDENGRYVLKKDAPQEAHEILETIQKKYWSID